MFISPWFLSHFSGYFFYFFCWIIIFCLLNFGKCDFGNRFFKDQGQLLIWGWVLSPTKEWFRGARQLLGISLIILSDGPYFVCLSLQKSPVQLPLCSLKDVSLLSAHQHGLSFKLAHCHSEEEREAEISEQSRENIWSVGSCLVGRGGKGLRWWCHEGRDSSR